jgi:hypothetical protein
MQRANDRATLQFIENNLMMFKFDEELLANPSPERTAQINAQRAAFSATQHDAFSFLQRIGQQRNVQSEQAKSQENRAAAQVAGTPETVTGSKSVISRSRQQNDTSIACTPEEYEGLVAKLQKPTTIGMHSNEAAKLLMVSDRQVRYLKKSGQLKRESTLRVPGNRWHSRTCAKRSRRQRQRSCVSKIQRHCDFRKDRYIASRGDSQDFSSGHTARTRVPGRSARVE